MKEFLERFPEHRKLSGSVTKHVSVMSTLSEISAKRRLIEVSEIEQSIVCDSDQSSAASVSPISLALALHICFWWLCPFLS